MELNLLQASINLLFFLQINKTVKLGSIYFPLNNNPDPKIVDQLGGIIKTIDSMQNELNNHELRPYEYWKVTQEPLIAKQFEKFKNKENHVNFQDQESESANEFFESENENSPQNFERKCNKQSRGRIISCSPFRAYKQIEI